MEGLTAMISKVLGGLTVAMGIAVFFLFRANASLNEEIGAARVSIQQAELTNQSNLATLDDIINRNNLCVAGRAADLENTATTVAQLESDFAALEAREEQVRIVREESFREPSCAELGEISITAVCPALASSLFNRADSID